MANQLNAAASPLPSKTAINIGGTEYNVDVTQIPYLSSFISFNTKARSDEAVPEHGPIPLFSAALEGLESGFRRCFRRVRVDLSEYHRLCETYDFLGVDVLDGRSLDDIFTDLKAGKLDNQWKHEYSLSATKYRCKGRDAAFKLLYLLLLGEFKNETKDAGKVYNAVLYAVSNYASFGGRTRKVLRMAYEDRFVITAKQRVSLDKWVLKDEMDHGNLDDESTTEEEDEYCDWDGYYNDQDWYI